MVEKERKIRQFWQIWPACQNISRKTGGGTSDSISIWNTDFSVLVDGFNKILFHPKWTPTCQFQTICQSFATFHSLREFPSQTWISSYFFHHQYLYLWIGVIYDLFSSGGLSSFYLKVLFHGGVAHSKQGKFRKIPTRNRHFLRLPKNPFHVSCYKTYGRGVFEVCSEWKPNLGTKEDGCLIYIWLI